jgi:uncharacterized membrane protein YeiH
MADLVIDDLLHALDFAGVAVFAISGALKAAEKEMDAFGFIMLAAVTGIGGGTLRDLLLGVPPVFWVKQPAYLALCVLVGLGIFCVVGRLRSIERWLIWADAVGLAAFCVLGAQLARTSGASILVAIVMGIMTATFGGLIRDILAGEVPLILRREVYATAAALGALVYLAALALGAGYAPSLLLGFAAALGLRGCAIAFGLSLPVRRRSR